MTEFKLRRPCPHCPFRTDVPPYLRGSRAAEIARSIAEGSTFPCHETTEWADEEVEADAEYTEKGGEQFCAGALIVMEHQGGVNQIVRIAERLGLYEAERLDMGAPVHRSLHAFVAHHAGDEEAETCSVCNPGCEAPAGMMIGGVVTPVEAEGEVHECPGCGEPVCDSCSDDEGVCDYCGEYEQ